MAQLAVGAVSRRVIEVAAEAQVAQIVASRRQVDTYGGYTGLDQQQLVDLVRDLSGGQTKVVRDHGGPNQGAQHDDGIESLQADMAAGFDILHLDVCKVPRFGRRGALRNLVTLAQGFLIDIGGEHTQWIENLELLHLAADMNASVSHVVVGHSVDHGTRIHADMQCGTPVPPHLVHQMQLEADTPLKLHNADWLVERRSYADRAGIDMVNIAPEAALAEIDALLAVADKEWTTAALTKAYASKAWSRWFDMNEGTWMQRAKCALRYVIGSPFVPQPELDRGAELFVRQRIREALYV